MDVAFRAACVESLGVLLELGVGGETKAAAAAWYSDQMEQRKKQVYKRGARLRESILFARNHVAAKTVRHIYREVNGVTRLLLCNVCTLCDGVNSDTRDMWGWGVPHCCTAVALYFTKY